jgi:hypothetical protein
MNVMRPSAFRASNSRFTVLCEQPRRSASTRVGVPPHRRRGSASLPQPTVAASVGLAVGPIPISFGGSGDDAPVPGDPPPSPVALYVLVEFPSVHLSVSQAAPRLRVKTTEPFGASRARWIHARSADRRRWEHHAAVIFRPRTACFGITRTSDRLGPQETFNRPIGLRRGPGA